MKVAGFSYVLVCICRYKQKNSIEGVFCLLAVRQGFEPWVPEIGTIDFESIAFDHSAILPWIKYD